jgi:hypothetical protein
MLYNFIYGINISYCQDLHFARQVMHRDPKTMVADLEIPSMLDDDALEQFRELGDPIDWARIFPTSWLDEVVPSASCISNPANPR